MESEKKGTASAELLDFAGPGADTFAFDKPLPPEPSASDLLDDFLKAEAGDFGFKNAVEPEKSSGKVDVDKDFGGFEETDDFDKFDSPKKSDFDKFDSPKKSDFGKIDISKDFDDFMEDSRSGGVGESPPLTPRPDYDFMAHEREASPMPREPMPLPKDSTPPPKQPSPSPPSPRQPSPAKEPTPPPKEPTPPPKEPTPPPKEPTPPPKEPTPPPKEPTPPPKEPTPPPKEPTPPPKEPTPPPKEPTPPPREPTPPPREPTPSPKEPTPPPKTPTPPREPSPLPREPTPTPPPTPVVKDPSPVKEFVKSSPVRERPASASDIAPKDLFVNIGLVESLVYWRDVKKSGVVFGVTLACLLSLVYCSLISVVSYLCLFTLFATVSFRIYKNVMQAVQKTSDGHPFKDLLEVDLEIKEDKAKEACAAVISHVNSWLTELRRLFLVVDLVDSLKFGVCLWALTYVGALFNGLSLIILCWIALFSLPKVYENNKQQIDASLELANSKISEITNKVKAALPGKKEEKKEQ